MAADATGQRWRRRAVTILWGVAGTLLAVALSAHVRTTVGPFDATLRARPSLHGDTVVQLAPLGSITLDTHTAPVAIEARVDELRLDEARTIANDPSSLDGVEDDLARDARSGLRQLGVRTLLVAVAGGALAAAAGTRSWRGGLAGGGVGAVLVVGAGLVALSTWRADAVAEPRYTGLLTLAPRAVGDARSIVERFGEYRAELADLVGNAVDLYQTAETLPTTDLDDDTIRLLHISDLHLNPEGYDLTRELVRQFKIDAVVDTGDITDWGTEPESGLLDAIAGLRVPYVYVRGNHDSAGTQLAVDAQPNGIVLDGKAATVAGLRIFGFADLRYTPNKLQGTGKKVEAAEAARAAPVLAHRLRDAEPPAVDLLMVHDARMAAAVGDLVPLVLSGHTHHARRGRVGKATLLVEGSTGGAGLRALKGETPLPLSASVLYFDRRTHRLVAYDQVSVSGLGGAGARIERHVLPTTTTTTRP